MRELRLLVDQFVRGNIAYGDFRRDVVARFLGISDQDPIVRQMYDLIEGTCSAFDNQYINDARLRVRLASLPRPVEQMMEAQNAAISIVSLPVYTRSIRPVSTSNWISPPTNVAMANIQAAVKVWLRGQCQIANGRLLPES